MFKQPLGFEKNILVVAGATTNKKNRTQQFF